MEKNLEKIYDVIKRKPSKGIELEEVTQIPKTTLYRSLKTLLDDGMIKNDNGVYYQVIPTPTIKELYDIMYVLHQQKLMDNRYRKLKPEGKTDDILISFINNPNYLKGRIQDYNQESLMNNILKSLMMLKQSV